MGASHMLYLCIMISELFSQWHISGLVVGLSTFLIIGFFHPIVIKSEYHFGVRGWWWFRLAGIAVCRLSVWVDNEILSILAGVVAFSSFWSIKEIFEQRERVLKGWFPMNPKRKHEYCPENR